MNRAQTTLLVLTLLLVSTAVAPTGAQEGAAAPTGRLVVVWTSGDPDVADKVCLMYTHAAKSYDWFADVTLVVWGPSQRLLVSDAAIQAKVRAMQDDGVVVQACVACARKLDLVAPLEALGIEVLGMGVPLSEALKDPDTQVLTF